LQLLKAERDETMSKMNKRASRTLLVIAAILSTAGAAFHLAAFFKALRIVAVSGMPPFYSNSFKALWLADSATMAILALICLAMTVRMEAANRLILALVALFPLLTAMLLYAFLGNFPAAHILMAIAVLMLLAGARLPGSAAGTVEHADGTARALMEKSA
jgi:uncharacterized membrane protein